MTPLRAARRPNTTLASPVVPPLALLFAVLFAVLAAPGWAQEAPGADDVAEEEVIPALASFGVTAGFPSNQTVAATAAIQSGPVGMALRAGYGPGAGPYGGATLRLYPPLPGMPVPLWLGGGAGVGVGGVVPHAALGVHVPVAQRLRLDVEAGAAWPMLGLERTTVPHLAVGVSYAFAVELQPVTNGSGAGVGAGAPRGAAASCEAGPPDPGLLGDALRRAEDSFVDDARATYGSLYRGLSYDLDVEDRDLDGDTAVLTLDYDGSVIEIATGERIEASGTATATFRWTGCDWRHVGLDY